MTPNSSPSDLLTTAQVAEILSLDTSTVNDWCRRGILTEAMKMPGLRGARLFRRSDIDTFMERSA